MQSFISRMYLQFSDSAKFADIARNLVNGLGYTGKFTFWDNSVFGYLKNAFPQPWTPPVMPFSIAAFFKIFGVSDFAVIATSFFYFVLTLLFVYLLAKRIFKSNLVGILSTVAVGFNYDLINYATAGASEAPFIFEIVAGAYLISLKKKWASAATVIVAILMYFTRPQAFIYVAGLLLFWLVLNFKTQKAFILFGVTLVAGFLVDYFVLSKLAGRYFLYSVTTRGIGVAVNVSAGGSASDSLRGASGLLAGGGLGQIIKKAFYDLYNFYKLAPQIVNPYLLALFVIGLFKWGKDGVEDSLKKSTIFIVILTLVVTAVSIPFFRYIHPVVPLIYIFSVEMLVWILGKILKSRKLIILFSSLVVLFFAAGQTLGVTFLDSRFVKDTHNVGQPPVYVALSKMLKDNTKSSDLVVTNLDTWGSWYGERRTVWYPVEPNQLIDSNTGKIPFDAIYLTSYLIDDQNYYMGASWREIFENPNNPAKWVCEGCGEIAKEFKVKGVYVVDSKSDYERQDAKAVLLIKR